MKIGILLLQMDPKYRGGINSFIHGLIGGIKKVNREHEFYLIMHKEAEEVMRGYENEKIKLFIFENERPWIKKIKLCARFLFQLPILCNMYLWVESILSMHIIRTIDKQKFDLCYSPFAPHFPLGLKTKVVVSPHDIQHVHYPEYFSFWEKRNRTVLFPLSLHRAFAIQASTQFIKKDFSVSLSIPQEKIFVIPEGVMRDFLDFAPNQKENGAFLETHLLEPGYIFYPAQLWPHKNHKTLVKALVYVKEKYRSAYKLVLTGTRDERYENLLAFVRENRVEEYVVFLDNIKFSELFYAYTNAAIVAIPVVYESSSLPLKEAMALGKPVVASRNGANEEANLDNNVALFGTYDYKELGELLHKLMNNEDMREKMGSRAKVVAETFDWQHIGKKYIQTFETLKKS